MYVCTYLRGNLNLCGSYLILCGRLLAVCVWHSALPQIKLRSAHGVQAPCQNTEAGTELTKTMASEV